MLRALLAALLPEQSTGRETVSRLQTRDLLLWQASLTDLQGVRTLVTCP